MNVKKMTTAILGTVIKVVLAIGIIFLVYKLAIGAYQYGYRIFEDKPVSEKPGREVTISVTEGKSAKELAEILESKGLVKDATVFYLQYMLSSFKDELLPGVYALNTSMSAEEMMEIMSEAPESEADGEAEE